jgi:hypothetical protein
LCESGKSVMKLRSFSTLLVVGVCILLLVGGIKFWQGTNSSLTLLKGASVTQPAAAIFMPRQAPVVASLLVSPDRLGAFRLALADSGERRQSRSELSQLQQSLLVNTGLDYQTDIQPWLGEEITLAVTTLDSDRDPSNGQQPGYLLTATIQDPTKAREFLQRFWEQRSLPEQALQVEQYQGVKLTYAQPSLLSSAMIGDRFILFANTPKVLKNAINNAQAPDLNLSSTPSYQQAVQHASGQQIGWVFLNLPQLSAWSRSTAVATDLHPPQFDRLAMAIRLDRHGLLAELIGLAAPNQIVPATMAPLTEPVPALQYIPANSQLVAAGTDLATLWTQLSAGVAGYDTLSRLLQQPIVALQRQWGVDLPQDIFSWVQGDYALALLPQSDPTNLDWLFVVKKSASMQATIADLDERARKQGYSIGPLMLGNQTVVTWSKLVTDTPAPPEPASVNLQAQVRGVHATVGQYEILSTSLTAMNAALQHSQAKSLITNPRFQQAIAPLPTPNSGYLYVDWIANQSLLNRTVPLLQWAKLAGQPVFSHLRSIVVSSPASAAGERRSTIFLQFGKVT